MAGLLTCSRCKTKYERDQLTFFSKNLKYCPSCLIIKNEEKRIAEEYKHLIQYICDGYKVKAPHHKVFRDIKLLKDKGYSYPQIEFAIFYAFNIINKPFDMQNFGYIEYIIDASIKFKEDYDRANNSNATLENKEVVIKVRPNTKPLLKNTRLIEIREL